MVNFEVNPTIALPLDKVIFFNKLLRDIIKIDLKIFRPMHWGGQVEIGHAKTCEFGI